MKRKPLIRKEESREVFIAEQDLLDTLRDENQISIPRSTNRLSERDRLITSQLHKAKKAAKYLAKRTKLNEDDLYSEACLALVHAYERWDSSRANYSTCVNNTIYGYLYNYLRDKTWLIKIPRKLNNAYLTINKQRRVNPDLTLEQISEISGVELNVLYDAELAYATPYSLDAMSQDEDCSFSYLEQVHDKIQHKF